MSSVGLQLDELDMKRLTYDVIVSPDNSNLNLKETCPYDVKKMMIMW